MSEITRYASPSFDFGPLAYLQDTWIGDSGWNVMVVPQVVDGQTSFLVMVQQLFETQVFTRVGAPVPNRGGEVGLEKILAVKYNQTAAEKASKNILHEEVGMWMYQTPSGTDNAGWSDTEAKFPYPVLRQGVIPHGNSILLSGNFEDAAPAQPAFPSESMAYLPSILTEGVDPEIEKAFIAAYKEKLASALALLPLSEQSGVTVENLVNPTTFLSLFRKQEAGPGKTDLSFDQVINMHVNAANAKGYGGLISIPFAHSYADPIDFDSYLSIQVVKNDTYSPKVGNTLDEVPDYFQLQYFQNIPIKFQVTFMDTTFVAQFPHYQLNTLVKI